jgi:hypothetical protein
MKTLVAAFALLAAMGASAEAKKSDRGEAAKAVDPNVSVAKEHGGKVWVVAGEGPSVEGEDLNKWLASHPAGRDIARQQNQEIWPISYVAVFKKTPPKGPMTVEFVDKADPKTTVERYSPSTHGSGLVFQEGYDLDPNNGFNKGHTYLVRVGQLINKKFVPYATGEVTLK